MLQLVDQVVAVKNVGASLGLTASPRARGKGGGGVKMRTTHRERNRKEELVRRQAGVRADLQSGRRSILYLRTETRSD